MAEVADPKSAPASDPATHPPAPREDEGTGSKQNGPTLIAGLTAFETVLVAGGIILFLVLLYEMEAFLSPPLIAAAGALMIWPLKHHRPVRAILISGGFLLLVWFFVELSSILIPFGIMYLLAYLCAPSVDFLNERLRLPRWLSSLGLTFAVVGLLTLIVLLLVPSIVNQVEVLAVRALDSLEMVRDWLQTSPMLDNLAESGVIDRDELTAQLNAFVQEQSRQVATGMPDILQFVLRSIESLLALVMILAVMPVMFFYTLKDYPYIKRRLIELFPTFGGRRDYLMRTGNIIGNYLRGQLTISLIAAIHVTFWFLVFNVPFALLLGILTGLLNMIPNIGAIITHILAVLVAFLFSDVWIFHVVVVLAVLTGQSLLEQSILTPKILSEHVGLHPVLIVLSLFIFGYFLGIFGLFIAVPVTAVIMTMYKAFREEMTLELSDYDTREPDRPGPSNG